MTSNMIGNIKKTMGWCPQEKVAMSTDYMNLSNHVLSSKKTPVNVDPVKSMEVPVQMFDWRLWIFSAFFIGLVLAGSLWAGTYRFVFYSLFILIGFLFIFFHTKVSASSEILRISTPVLGDTIIPVKSIISMKISENYACRHKLRTLVSSISVILLSVSVALSIQNPVMKKLYMISIFGFAMVLFFTIRISDYPKMIWINAGGRDILLYPRNEHDFLILKNIPQVNRIEG